MVELNDDRVGDSNAQCDLCGVDYKRSKMRKMWTGTLRCFGPGTTNCWEPRQPQDFVRGVVDRQGLRDPRPQNIHFLPLACPDKIEVTGGEAFAFDVLANDTYATLSTITWVNIPDAGTEGVITYTDAGAAEQTVVAGVAISVADYNSPMFTAASNADGTLPLYFYDIVDTQGFTSRSYLCVDATPLGLQFFNIVFLVDASDGAVTAGSNSLAIAEAVGDVNGDAKSNSHFDMSLQIIDEILAQFVADGIGSNVRVGIFSFESQIPGAEESPSPAAALTSGTTTVFTPTTDFSAIYADYVTAGTPFGDNGSDLVDNGIAYFAPALEAANDFIEAVATGNDVNLAYFITASVGADVGNDYVGAGGPGVPDGTPDGFIPVEVLESLPTVGPLFEALDLTDVPLSIEMLRAADLGIEVETIYFGGSIATNSALYALENAGINFNLAPLGDFNTQSIGDRTDLNAFLATLSDTIDLTGDAFLTEGGDTLIAENGDRLILE